MKHGRTPFLKFLRSISLATALGLLALGAQADEYSEVTQLIRAAKLGEALNKADHYLASKPRDPQMRFLKGVILRDSNRASDAITVFTKLTEDYPELPEPYNNLAVLYASQSQYDKARAALEMAIRTNPSYATAHENLGDVYAKLASQAYNKALQLDSGNTAVQPKLSLIRELFNPAARGQRPAMPSTPTTLAPAATAAASTPTPANTPAPLVPNKQPPAPSSALLKPTTPTTAPTPAPSETKTAPAPTPAPQAQAAAPVKAPVTASVTDTSAKDAKEAEAAVRAWARAWAAKDMQAYLGAYGREFTPPGKVSRSAWEEERRKRIAGKSTISVKLEQVQVSVRGNKAVVKFRQDYKADALAVSSRKSLELSKSGDRWLIVKESVGN